MKKIFYTTYSSMSGYSEMMRDIVKHSFDNNLIDKYLENKKIVFLCKNLSLDNGNTQRYSGYNTKYFFQKEYFQFIIVDKDVNFIWKDNTQGITFFTGRSQKLSDGIIELNENTLFDSVVELSKNYVGEYVQLEMSVDFLRKLWDFTQKENHLYDIKNYLNLIMSDEQLIKYKQEESKDTNDLIKNYFKGLFAGMKEEKGKLFKELEDNLIILLFVNSNRNCSYKADLLNMSDEVVKYMDSYNSLMAKLFIDYYKDNDSDKLKKFPYFINWDYDESKLKTSLYKNFEKVFDSYNLNESAKERLIKKCFSIQPAVSYVNDSMWDGIDNYFLTLKDFNKEVFYKRLADFFKTRLTVENKQANLVLFESLMNEEEIENQKELFESIFPIFYQGEISFKDFIEMKEKEIKYAELKIKDLMDLFPLNRSYENIMEKYVLFIKNIMNNYNVDVFSNNKSEIIKEKKKEREVISVIQFYFSGDDLSFLSNDFIQKMLRQIHDVMDLSFGNVQLEDISREIYLKLNLSESEATNKKKNKI